MTKRMMLVVAVLLLAAPVGAMTLAEAGAKTSAIIENPEKMTEVMKELSAADQKTFVGQMNAKLASLPGSAESRAAKINAVNRAALMGAAKGNVPAIVAEIFATAPVESLTVLNESFSKDIFNRSADPSKTYTDAQFTEISKTIVAAVNERLAGAKDAGVRGGFAALMMVRASNGSPANLSADLASMLGTSSEVANGEWFPEALADMPNYDPMLSSLDITFGVPDVMVTLAISGVQRHFVLLSSVMSSTSSRSSSKSSAAASSPVAADNANFGDTSQPDNTDSGVLTLPRTRENLPWNPEIPRGYDWQKIK